MQTLVIRRATLNDVPEIARIYNQAVDDRIATADTIHRSLEDRTRWFEEFFDRYGIWIGEVEGKVVGYCGLIRYTDKDGYRYATENTVYVAREARGRGYGKTLLEHVVIEAKKAGFRYVLARIFSHNETSLWLHSELGFRVLGVQTKIVEMDGRWYDVTLMDLNL